MNFDLNDEERALQQGVRDVCKRLFPMERVRALENEPGGLDRKLWRELGDAGVFAIRLPEPDGVGLGMTQAVLVFEELGRAIVPGPLVSTHLAAGLIDGAATGEVIVGMTERSRSPRVVGHLTATDTVAVVDTDGISQVDPAGITATPIDRPLDPLTPMHLVEDLPDGERIAGADVAQRWRLEGATLISAMEVGVAAACVDQAVAYAKERKQFGRVIGSFQAVKHICADMLVRAELARAAVHAAGVMLDDPSTGNAERAVAGARLLAAETAIANGKANIQVHGGMGYTWEVDAHLFLKRAVVLATRFGRASEWAETIARTL
ncbi:MAG: acyl-CoA dehydrogenase family protein [Actinomycetota bacterium]